MKLINFEIFMVILAICGLIMLISGWSASINSTKCPNSKKSAIKSAKSSLAIGTCLLTLSMFYLLVIRMYSRIPGVIDKAFSKNKQTPLFLVISSLIIGIFGISLSSVILNGVGDIDKNDKNDKNDACKKMKSDGILLLIPSIIIVSLAILFFYFNYKW